MNSSVPRPSWLPWFLKGLLIFGFLILFGRVFELQVIKGKTYRDLSDGNRIRRVPILAPRGEILARGGEVLVGNIKVQKEIVFDPQTGYKKIDSQTNSGEVITEWNRDYKLGAKFAHGSGYLGFADLSEVGKVNPSCPEKGLRRSDTLVGRSGLEEQYECDLAGIDGEELIEVDTIGRRIRILGVREPISGKNLITTIDYHLQEKVAEIMDTETNHQGAAVVTDSAGQILALYSLPSFDPNMFNDSDRVQEVSDVLISKSLPLFNRVTSGVYHPGSVFKPTVVAAGLQEGKIDENYLFEDTGLVRVGDYSYTNWFFTQYGKTEGKINVVKALARSTDTYFYNLGGLLGIDKLTMWANNLGFGKKTGIDLPGENAGLVPTPSWKKSTIGEPWFLGNTYHVSIGQGDMLASPIQINVSIAALASGKLCSPRMTETSACKEININKKNLDVIRRGMIDVCLPGGTGFTFFDFAPANLNEKDKVACKTGTAETGEIDKTHAWFTAYSPVNDPEIVATIMIEKSGEGSKVAGPLMRKVFDYWFGRGIKNE